MPLGRHNSTLGPRYCPIAVKIKPRFLTWPPTSRSLSLSHSAAPGAFSQLPEEPGLFLITQPCALPVHPHWELSPLVPSIPRASYGLPSSLAGCSPSSFLLPLQLRSPFGRGAPWTSRSHRHSGSRALALLPQRRPLLWPPCEVVCHRPASPREEAPGGQGLLLFLSFSLLKVLLIYF